MKQITITVPDNCELKQDGNTYTIVEKEKKLTTYEDVVKKLFDAKTVYWIDKFGKITYGPVADTYLQNPNNASNEQQLEKLLAINKLMNVAKYLNDGWQPDWDNNDDHKWFICFENDYKKLSIEWVYSMQQHFIYFKSKELARKAIDILGEETIKLALFTDY